jgi:hypothetical protein
MQIGPLVGSNSVVVTPFVVVVLVTRAWPKPLVRPLSYAVDAGEPGAGVYGTKGETPGVEEHAASERQRKRSDAFVRGMAAYATGRTGRSQRCACHHAPDASENDR